MLKYVCNVLSSSPKGYEIVAKLAQARERGVIQLTYQDVGTVKTYAHSGVGQEAVSPADKQYPTVRGFLLPVTLWLLVALLHAPYADR